MIFVRKKKLAGGGTPFELVETLPFDRAVAASPWDDTIDVPAGADRLIVGFDLNDSNDSGTSAQIDPGGADEAAIDQAVSSEAASRVIRLLLTEADMPAAAAYTWRHTWNAARAGSRQVHIITGASQTVFEAGTSNLNLAAITVSVTRPSGTFPAGSLVFASLCCGQDSLACTVTGDAAEISGRDVAVGGGRMVHAQGTLGSAQASASVTFTFSSSRARNLARIMVVEPA